MTDMTDRFQHLRLLEALLFAAAEPLRTQDLARHLPDESDVNALLEELATVYANRGVILVRHQNRWAFRTAPDLASLMQIETNVKRKLSRAAVETLAIIAYHQPVTRAEIEEIRGVGLSRGTLDTLLEAVWIRPRGRRKTPGRPVTWGTTDRFLDHFGLETLDALPGKEELKAAGLLSAQPALAALGGEALLAPVDLASPEEDDAEEGDESEALEPAEALAADFGDDLVPKDGGEDAEGGPDEPLEETAATAPPENLSDRAAQGLKGGS